MLQPCMVRDYLTLRDTVSRTNFNYCKRIQSMVNGDHFHSLSRVSVFEEDVRGQISLVVVHDSLVSCAVTDVEFCKFCYLLNVQPFQRSSELGKNPFS